MPLPFEDPNIVARGSFVLKQYESDGQYRLTLVNLPQEISSDLQHYQQQQGVEWKWSGVAFWGGQTTREYSLALGLPYVSPKREVETARAGWYCPATGQNCTHDTDGLCVGSVCHLITQMVKTGYLVAGWPSFDGDSGSEEYVRQV